MTPMIEDRLIANIGHELMAHNGYSVLIRPYLGGQYRIQLCGLYRSFPDDTYPEGHGDIIREMCTYESFTAGKVLAHLRKSKDPERFCRKLTKPWNCEGPGQRIRLDTKKEDIVGGKRPQKGQA